MRNVLEYGALLSQAVDGFDRLSVALDPGQGRPRKRKRKH